jgi:hypothetical protein
MDEDPIRVETEEPFPGWLRVEVEGRKPSYRSPFPRTTITSAAKLGEFLEKEQSGGRMLDVDVSQFSFKRRMGLKKRSAPPPPPEADDTHDPADAIQIPASNNVEKSRSVVELLTRDHEVDLDHRKMFSNLSKKIDAFRPKDNYETPESFDALVKELSTAVDMKDLLSILSGNPEVVDSLSVMLSDLCMAEISQIDTEKGPMIEFPVSVNENCYCEIAEYGMLKCPRLMAMVITMVVRREESVLPKDVLRIATCFANLCYIVNRDINAMVKLRSLTMQVDGLTNMGLNILADVGLAQTARTLSNHRDLFAEVGIDVMNSTAARYPLQSTLDNCDLQSEHLTLETIEKETVDTTDLSTTRLRQAIKLICVYTWKI